MSIWIKERKNYYGNSFIRVIVDFFDSQYSEP